MALARLLYPLLLLALASTAMRERPGGRIVVGMHVSSPP